MARHLGGRRQARDHEGPAAFDNGEPADFMRREQAQALVAGQGGEVGRVHSGKVAHVQAFDAIAAAIDYPMYVATTVDPSSGARAGCLVGFTTQCSIDPVRFLVCLSKANHTFDVAGGAELVAVHLLAASQRGLAELFGSETGDEVDKFSRCAWKEGPGGLPVLCDAPAWFAGRVVARVDLGDHVGYVLEPAGGAIEGSVDTYLTFHAARDMEPGHEA